MRVYNGTTYQQHIVTLYICILHTHTQLNLSKTANHQEFVLCKNSVLDSVIFKCLCNTLMPRERKIKLHYTRLDIVKNLLILRE